jgi:predicted DNA-binding transcriptional regulator YafY
MCAAPFQYNGRKQQKLKNSGAEYVCSPWMLVWNGDCYYLLGHTDKHGVTPFRVDRIALPPHILEEDAVPQPEDFDITRVNTMFGMFIGEPQRVTLVCDNSVMDHIVDRFGEDVETVPVDGKTFQASVLVTASKPFFGWVFGFDGKVRITAPAKVKREYEKMLQRAISQD